MQQKELAILTGQQRRLDRLLQNRAALPKIGKSAKNRRLPYNADLSLFSFFGNALELALTSGLFWFLKNREKFGIYVPDGSISTAGTS